MAVVYGWIMDRLPRFRSRQVSGCVFAVGRLNLYNAELVGALMQVGEQHQPAEQRHHPADQHPSFVYVLL